MSKEPPPRTRIVMLGAFPPQSQGVMDYCAELVQALATRYDVTGVGFRAMYPSFLYPGEKASVDATKATLGGPHLQVIHPLTYFNPLSWLRAACMREVDVFHVQWWSLPLWLVSLTMMLVMRLRRKPVVLTIHNVLPHGAAPHRRRWLFVAATRVLTRVAHRVVVHSQANRAQLRRYLGTPEGKVHQVSHGIFVSKVRHLDPATCRRRLGIDNDAQVLLLYGALRDYKGLDVLLDAFAQVVPRYPRARLVIAGKLWMDWAPFAATIERASLENAVHVFPTFVPEAEVPVIFSAADLVVLPYTAFDAQSGVAATALPYAKPILVSRAGGLPDWVDHDADWIVEPGDVAGLSSRLAAFLDDPDGQQVAFRAVAERVLRASSWDTVVDAYGPVYQRLGAP